MGEIWGESSSPVAHNDVGIHGDGGKLFDRLRPEQEEAIFLNMPKSFLISRTEAEAESDAPLEVVRADHDYLELTVNVKVEKPELVDDDDEGEEEEEVSPPIVQEDFFNLSQLAEVSLAAEGRIDDVNLSERIQKARLDQGKRKMLQLAQVASREKTNGVNNGYTCSDCGKAYSTSSNLARHKQTHRSLEDKKAKKCPHCSKIYVSMPAFSMHLRTHNQTCKCHICGKAFSRPWLLQGHVRTHTGERPFPCHLCPKAFADKSNLRAHVQTHSTDKPYKCGSCGKSFALKSYLYKHEESSCTSATRK